MPIVACKRQYVSRFIPVHRKRVIDVSALSAAMPPRMSIVLPTRERGYYLEYALRSCARSRVESLEILVIDNASTDNTGEIVARCADPRIRYIRNDRRLSMHDNFERGLEEARGDIICMLGDDDAILPSAPEMVLGWMEGPEISAAACHRAYYGWPDLQSGRSGMALVPRRADKQILSSRNELSTLLYHADYYRLPCLYHGFVRRAPVERIRTRQGRFFLSNNPDIYSAVSLSMEGLDYVYSLAPLIVNGGSSRSNGASHFGGAPELEKQLWIQEDNLGTLPGFEDMITIDAVIIETALRYCRANSATLEEIFDPISLRRCLGVEVLRREQADRNPASNEAMLAEAGFNRSDIAGITLPPRNRLGELLRAFRRTIPIDLKQSGIIDVDAAASAIEGMVRSGRTGFLSSPLRQASAAMSLAR